MRSLPKRILAQRGYAPLTIALGPGFTAGQDVDVVVETKRGHRLGRIIRRHCHPQHRHSGRHRRLWQGAGHPCTGRRQLQDVRQIGDIVEAGETIAQIQLPEAGASRSRLKSAASCAPAAQRLPVTPGFKVADVDPRREELSNCFLISDKSRCIAGSVLELVCAQLWN